MGASYGDLSLEPSVRPNKPSKFCKPAGHNAISKPAEIFS